MKVIFLDVDGVLNTYKYTRDNHSMIDNTYKFLEREKISLLKNIVEQTGAKLVLSSSWRSSLSFGLTLKLSTKLKSDDFLGMSLIDALGHEGLTLYSKIPDLNDDRAVEINAWLAKHPNIQHFIILDDTHYNWGSLQPYWLQTSGYTGLNEQISQQAITMLNKTPES